MPWKWQRWAWAQPSSKVVPITSTPPTPGRRFAFGAGAESRGKWLTALAIVTLAAALLVCVIILAVSAGSDGSATQADADSDSFPQGDPFRTDRVLLWTDEFNAPELNQNMWAYDVGNGCDTDFGCGWGNKELQSYRAANAFLEGGQLVVEAVSEYPVLSDGSSFSSGRVHSIVPATVLYGLVEAKITMGSGVGPWGSFFLLPEENVYGDWPGSGEIDVVQMASLSRDSSSSIVSGLRYGFPLGEGAQGNAGCTLRDGESVAEETHVYGVLWTPAAIQFFVDGILYCDLSHWWAGNALTGNSTAPFNQKFQVVLSLAVGGNLPQIFTPEAVDATALPLRMSIDYVRVYDLQPTETARTGAQRPFPGPISNPDTTGVPLSGYTSLQSGVHTAPTVSRGLVRLDQEFFDVGGQGAGFGERNPTTNRGDCAVRPHDGVEVFQDDLYYPQGSEGFQYADLAGAYVRYAAGEWTSHSIYLPAPLQPVCVEIRHSTLRGGGFKLLLDSTNCTSPRAPLLISAPTLTPAPVATNLPPPVLGLAPKCWQTQRWAVALPAGYHRLVFCSAAENLNVQYMDIIPFEPDWPLLSGPNCDATA